MIAREAEGIPACGIETSEDIMTIKQIAEALNVSAATVSNVIHGHLEKMSPETAQMIRKKIEEYQYIPNMGARMLAKGASNIIGVVTNYPNLKEKYALQDPFVSEMIGGLDNAIQSAGYYMMLHAAQNLNEICHIAGMWNTDGLIVLGLQADQCGELVQKVNKPIVFVDCYFHENEHYNNVGLDDRGGMCLLTRYAIAAGHRSILFIGDQPRPIGVDDYRLRGHQDALEEAGIEWNEDNYFCLPKEHGRRIQSFEELAAKIGKYTLFMFPSDYYAVDAMDWFMDHGYRIPDDISITGFDDNILSQVIRPRLTTVHQDVSQKAENAVKVLIGIISGTSEGPQEIVLKPRLRLGDSLRKIV